LILRILQLQRSQRLLLLQALSLSLQFEQVAVLTHQVRRLLRVDVQRWKGDISHV
jgi:hypothetical protein